MSKNMIYNNPDNESDTDSDNNQNHKTESENDSDNVSSDEQENNKGKQFKFSENDAAFGNIISKIKDETQERTKKAELLRKKLEIIAQKKKMLDKQTNDLTKQINTTIQDTPTDISIIDNNPIQQCQPIRTNRFKPNRQKITSFVPTSIPKPIVHHQTVTNNQPANTNKSIESSNTNPITQPEKLNTDIFIKNIPKSSKLNETKDIIVKSSKLNETKDIIVKSSKLHETKDNISSNTINEPLLFKILSDVCKENEKPIIKSININKDLDFGIRLTFTLDPEALKYQIYSINYVSDREKLLATLNKRDNLTTISRSIDNKNISLLKNNTLRILVVDLYTETKTTILQEIILECMPFNISIISSIMNPLPNPKILTVTEPINQNTRKINNTVKYPVQQKTKPQSINVGATRVLVRR
jgi:hypothetical protein